MAKIKICGLRREADIHMVNKYRPDYIGFVFADSKRRVTREEAAALKKQLAPEIKAVGVFVNAPAEQIAILCREGVIDMVQLHGDEKADYISHLKSSVSNPIIKAVRTGTPRDIEDGLALGADYLLLDTYSPIQYGGIGKTFDWSMIPKDLENFFLAGGLNSSNILQAIRSSRPYCVDISSGVETGGFKDEEKVKEIIEAVRAAEVYGD